MKDYKYLLFDADNTLFDFNKCENEAFKLAVTPFGVEYTDEIYAMYHIINDNLWKLLEKGGTTRDELKVERYRQLFEALGCDADCVSVAKSYEKCLGNQHFEIEGNYDVVKKLYGKYKLYVITNGLTTVQNSRFSKSRLTPLFEKIYISEQMGASKPSSAFFDEVIRDIGDSELSHYLVIGDSLTSDIDGAIGYGIDSCWYNRDLSDSGGRDITYEIKEMSELLSILN